MHGSMATKLSQWSLRGVQRLLQTATRRPCNAAASKHMKTSKDYRSMKIFGGFSLAAFAAGISDFDRIKKNGASFESAKKKLNLKVIVSTNVRHSNHVMFVSSG